MVHSWTAVIHPDIFEVGNFRDFLKLPHGGTEGERDLEMNCQIQQTHLINYHCVINVAVEGWPEV